MGQLRVAVIGVGHLGKEHARILASLDEVELIGVADVNQEQAQTVARRFGCRAYGNYRPLLQLADAVVIAVPTTDHHLIAGECLRAAIPVLVEKPLAATLEQADLLVNLARRQQTLLQVGHIERFNPAVEDLQRRTFRPKFIECERLGPFTGRSTDIGVVLDLMIHDLDILLTLVAAPVVRVEALGVAVFGGHEDVANARLTFANGCIANVTACRASPAPHRRMRIWAPEGFASIDFANRRLTLTQPSESVRRYGLDPRRMDPASRALLKEELFGRHFQTLEKDCRTNGDQLTRELQEFVHCVRTGARPRVGGVEARDAIALATRILHELRNHRWDGIAEGPVGPSHWPAPLGPLFETGADSAAA